MNKKEIEQLELEIDQLMARDRIVNFAKFVGVLVFLAGLAFSVFLLTNFVSTTSVNYFKGKNIEIGK